MILLKNGHFWAWGQKRVISGQTDPDLFRKPGNSLCFWGFWQVNQSLIRRQGGSFYLGAQNPPKPPKPPKPDPDPDPDPNPTLTRTPTQTLPGPRSWPWPYPDPWDPGIVSGGVVILGVFGGVPLYVLYRRHGKHQKSPFLRLPETVSLGSFTRLIIN